MAYTVTKSSVSFDLPVETQSNRQSDLISWRRPEQSGSCCVIQMKEVKNIASARSPCGLSGMRGEEGCVFLRWHMVFLSVDRSTSPWPSRVSRQTAETGLVFGAPSSPPPRPPPAALSTWSVFDLKFAAHLVKPTEKRVTLELQYSNCTRCLSNCMKELKFAFSYMTCPSGQFKVMND